jgi:hypothetical protein
MIEEQVIKTTDQFVNPLVIMDWAFKNDPDCNKVTGHLSENGHKKFSAFLLEKIKA